MSDARFSEGGLLKKSIRISLIYEYLEALMYALKKKFDLLAINYPYVGIYNNDFHTRLINFDNKYTTDIYQFYDPLKNIKLYKAFENVILETDKKGIICYFNHVNRDNENSLKAAVCETKLLIGLKIKSAMKTDASLIDYLLHTMISTINHLSNELLGTFNLNTMLKRAPVIDMADSEKNEKSFNINRYLRQIIQNQKAVLFNKLNLYKNDLFKINFDEHLYDKDAYYNYVLWDDKIKEPLNIFEIYFNKIDVNEFIEANELNHKLSRSKYEGNYLIITLNFSKLMLYLLNAKHIAEVCFSPWDKEEIMKFIKEGVDYL